MPLFNILCLSHLAWQKDLFQRPQQLMREMSRRGHRVLYIGCIGAAENRKYAQRGQRSGVIPGKDDGQVHFRNSSYPAFRAKFMAPRRYIARQLIAAKKRASFDPQRDTLLWIYHPSLLKLALPTNAQLTVYDVMDRFDSFGASHTEVATDERTIMQHADLIFAGGRALQQHAQEIAQHANATAAPVICLPSGVDLQHFRKPESDADIPTDIAHLPKPILGYFGAVDERIDFELLQQIARERPNWSILLIGPRLSAPVGLPSNLHLIGPRYYENLPRYLAAFDVALLPFKQTKLVAHISPTKTPEYLAGGKPVVSTPIPDVEQDYRDVVTIASDAKSFIAACERAIQSPPPPRQLRDAAIARALTWAQIAERMETHILEKLGQKRVG